MKVYKWFSLFCCNVELQFWIDLLVVNSSEFSIPIRFLGHGANQIHAESSNWQMAWGKRTPL